MKKIFLFTILIAFAYVASAQRRLKPIGEIEQSIWGEADFQGLRDGAASQQFLIFPSFEEPSAFYIYRGDSKCQLEVKDKKGTHRMMADELTTRKIKTLFEHSINVAMYPFENEGCDGRRYFFFDGWNGATCWSPYGNCKRLVNVMTHIMSAVVNKSKKDLDAQIPAIDSLCIVFKGFYPEEFFKHSYEGYNLEDKYTQIYLSFILNDFFVRFEYPKEKSPEELEAEVDKKYKDIIEKVNRDLFINTTALDIPVTITVNNDKPREFGKKEYNRKSYTLHEEDITEENLKQILLGNNKSIGDNCVKIDNKTITIYALGIIAVIVLLIDILRHSLKKKEDK